MKEVIAIIRRDKLYQTKEELAGLGFPSISIQSVDGRGKQKGDVGCGLEAMDEDSRSCVGLHVKLTPTPSTYALDHTLPKIALFIPKRMLTMVVPDAVVPTVVDAIVRVNRTGQYGDGKVFVAPMEDARRIRTGELSEEAIA